MLQFFRAVTYVGWRLCVDLGVMLWLLLMLHLMATEFVSVNWIHRRWLTLDVGRNAGVTSACRRKIGRHEGRALGVDVLGSFDSVPGINPTEQQDWDWVEDKNFPQVPTTVLHPQFWKTKKMGKWGNTEEHITTKERAGH